MKVLFFVLIFSFFIGSVSAQSDLNKMVETEKAFARMAAEQNTRAAFLEFSAADGVLFTPAPTNAKTFWTARAANSSLLAWTPEFADISSNGILGYTTGPWEFRPKGKADAPAGFGHFITIWQKQSDGNYRFVLDFGINHSKIALSDIWTAPTYLEKGLVDKGSAADISAQFFEMANKESIEKAYKNFAADDIRLYRNEKVPFLGKKDALKEVKKVKDKINFAKRSFFTSAANLAYISNSYTLTDKTGKETEKGYFLQIWKFKDGRWQIVLDLFKANPKE